MIIKNKFNTSSMSSCFKFKTVNMTTEGKVHTKY